MASYYVTFVVTVYGEFFNEPNSSPREMSEGFISRMQSLIKPMCFRLRLEALLELQNPWIDKESVVFRFTGSFMIVNIIILYIDHASSAWPPLPPLFSLTIPKQTNKKKTAGTSHKKFLNENKHM